MLIFEDIYKILNIVSINFILPEIYSLRVYVCFMQHSAGADGHNAAGTRVYRLYKGRYL